MLGREGDDAAELRIEVVDAVEIDVGEAFGGELAFSIQRESLLTGA